MADDEATFRQQHRAALSACLDLEGKNDGRSIRHKQFQCIHYYVRAERLTAAHEGTVLRYPHVKNGSLQYRLTTASGITIGHRFILGTLCDD